MKILLIEDDLRLSRLVAGLLTQSGGDVHTASSGDEALSLASQIHFPLILTDLMVPGLSGWQLVKSLSDKTPLSEVVVLTNMGSGSDIDAIKTDGGYRIFSKVTLSPQIIHDLVSSANESEV